MTTPKERLAAALEALRKLQDSGKTAIRSSDLSRAHRELLKRSGFLQQVMKGWYIPARPHDDRGESTAWYASYWAFCATYFAERFGGKWCLSPEHSLRIHIDRLTVPHQLLVRSPGAENKCIDLPFHTSIFPVRAELPPEDQIEIRYGLRIYSLPAALVEVGPGFFTDTSLDARSALTMVKDASTVLEPLLAGGRTVVAGRLAGAFRDVGRADIADDILQTMRAAGYRVWETNPFDTPAPAMEWNPGTSAATLRLALLWRNLRRPVTEAFPSPPDENPGPEDYLRAVENNYVTDAYHSLSIEGYRVSPELIDKVRRGTRDPENNPEDEGDRNALAARGYYEAFQSVKEGIARVLQGANPVDVARTDHRVWYQHLFAPSVRAGIIEAFHLAGYRSSPVFIRGSRHVPPRHEVVPDLMNAFFDLLGEEPESSVRVVLGHFVFVYIHPYSDGNGRVGRFLMNLMLAAGGYPWTVIPLDLRAEYMRALESASVDEDIGPFAALLGRLVRAS